MNGRSVMLPGHVTDHVTVQSTHGAAEYTATWGAGRWLIMGHGQPKIWWMQIDPNHL